MFGMNETLRQTVLAYASRKRKRDDEDDEREPKKSAGCKLEKIISGGQTGADRAGLEAAEHLGLATGGSVPHGFMTSSGPMPDLGSRFGLVQLRQMSIGVMYQARSRRNVDDSDGTLAIRMKSSVGTDKTIGYCLTKKWMMYGGTVPERSSYKPVLVIDKLDDSNHEMVRTWLIEHEIKTLNIVGHREYGAPIRPFGEKVKAWLIKVLEPLVNHSQTTQDNSETQSV